MDAIQDVKQRKVATEVEVAVERKRFRSGIRMAYGALQRFFGHLGCTLEQLAKMSSWNLIWYGFKEQSGESGVRHPPMSTGCSYFE